MLTVIAEWCLEKKKEAFQCFSVKLYDNCEQTEFVTMREKWKLKVIQNTHNT